MGRRTGRRSVVNTLASTSRAAAEHLRRFQSACRLGYSEFNNLTSSVADPDPGSGAFFTPRSGMGRKSASGSGIRDEQPGSYFLQIRNHFCGFFGVKILKILWCGSGVRDGESSDPGWKKFGSEIRDKHPGSATLLKGFTSKKLPNNILFCL